MSNQHTKYKNRLLKLAAFLDELPPERFDYGSWTGWNWAATMPLFRREGLRLRRFGSSSSEGVVCMKDEQGPMDNGTAFRAATKVFGITIEDSRYLFAPGRIHGEHPGLPISPRFGANYVATHIRQFVAWKWPSP